MFALLLAVLIAIDPQIGPGTEYVIGSHDILSITLFDQTDLSGKYTVDADGGFTFPLVGRVRAAGLTLRQFEIDLRQRLADGYFKNPQVSVGIEQYRSQRIFVVGEVRQPGAVPLTGGMTLIEALARAGSTLPSASGDVIVVRAREPRAEHPTLPSDPPGATVLTASIRDLQNGQLAQNIELRDGDTLFVARAEFAYVFGEVRNPGSFAVGKGTTVLQALSLAGGVTAHGAMNRIRIVRLVDGEKKEFRVKTGDTVRPGDTVVVPRRFF